MSELGGLLDDGEQAVAEPLLGTLKWLGSIKD